MENENGNENDQKEFRKKGKVKQIWEYLKMLWNFEQHQKRCRIQLKHLNIYTFVLQKYPESKLWRQNPVWSLSKTIFATFIESQIPLRSILLPFSKLLIRIDSIALFTFDICYLCDPWCGYRILRSGVKTSRMIKKGIQL